MTEELLLETAGTGDSARVLLCLQKGADINTRQPGTRRTPLMIAVMRWGSMPSFIKLFIDKGADLFLKDIDGKSAFDHARNIQDFQQRRKITDMLLQSLPDATDEVKTETPKADFNINAATLGTNKELSPVKSISFGDKKAKDGKTEEAEPLAKEGRRFNL